MAGDEEVEAVVELVAQGLWNRDRQTRPGKGVGMEPPWGDRDSGQTSRFYDEAEAIVDRVRSRPVDGTDSENHEAVREKVARALAGGVPWDELTEASRTRLLHNAKVAIAVIEAERVSFPAGGTEGEDHEREELVARIIRERDEAQEALYRCENDLAESRREVGRRIEREVGAARSPLGEDHEAGNEVTRDDATAASYAEVQMPDGSVATRDDVFTTSDAVRGDLHGTPDEWPGRQPTDPDRGQLRDAATPASGRGRQSDEMQMIDTARKVADFAYEQGVGDAIAVDQLIQKYRALREERDHALDDIEMLSAVNARLVKDIDQARINAACVGEMADEAEAEVKRLTAIDPRPEQPAPDRLSGQPTSEPEEER